MLAPDVANMYLHKTPVQQAAATSETTRAFRLCGPLPVTSSSHRTTFRHPLRRFTQLRFNLRFPPSGPLVREICNQAPNPSLRPTYREVTACGGTFPDTVTYLHGLNTPICPASFRETRSLQAPHLPENGTFIQNRRICRFQAVARSPLPAPAAATSWLS